jgi:F0F1-type ATP synthase membrane subunit c/vacuolar-type H+-ATPase subunit K
LGWRGLVVGLSGVVAGIVSGMAVRPQGAPEKRAYDFLLRSLARQRQQHAPDVDEMVQTVIAFVEARVEIGMVVGMETEPIPFGY